MRVYDVWLRVFDTNQGLYLYVKKYYLFLLIELNVLVFFTTFL
jgi:hypothetical protein